MNLSILSSAVLSIVCAVLFGLDLLGYFTPVMRPIASLTDGFGTVRRLQAHELSWDRAQIGTLFAKKDAVATGEESWAKIGFDAGGELELGPGSLVVLADHPEALKLQFISGTGKVRIDERVKNKFKVTRIIGKTSETQRAVSPREEETQPSTDVPRSEIELSPHSNDSSVEVEWVKQLGMYRQKTPEKTLFRSLDEKLRQNISALPQEEMRIALRTAASLDPELLDRLPPSPKTLSPKDGEILDLDVKKMPYLRWKASPRKGTKFAKYEVVIRAAELESTSQLFTTKRPWLRLTLDPVKQPGRYLWAVRSITEKGQKSPVSSFNWFEVATVNAAEAEVNLPKVRAITPVRKPLKRKPKRPKRQLPRVTDKPEVYPVIIK